MKHLVIFASLCIFMSCSNASLEPVLPDQTDMEKLYNVYEMPEYFIHPGEIFIDTEGTFFLIGRDEQALNIFRSYDTCREWKIFMKDSSVSHTDPEEFVVYDNGQNIVYRGYYPYSWSEQHNEWRNWYNFFGKIKENGRFYPDELDMDEEGNLYLTGLLDETEVYILFSSDRGMSWEILPPHEKNKFHQGLFCFSNRILKILKQTGLYYSDDKGQNWTLVSGLDSKDLAFSSNVGWKNTVSNAIIEGRNGKLYMCNSYSNYLLISPDNGESWQKISFDFQGYNLQDILYVDETGNIFASYIFTNYSNSADIEEKAGIYKSSDGGKTWEYCIKIFNERKDWDFKPIYNRILDDGTVLYLYNSEFYVSKNKIF